MTLTQEEMVEILEDMARNSHSATAQIQAIKVLRDINDGQKPPSEGFAELDKLTKRNGKS